MPIFKHQKDSSNPNFYRPNSLTFCLCTTLEFMENVFLSLHLQSRYLFIGDFGFGESERCDMKANFLLDLHALGFPGSILLFIETFPITSFKFKRILFFLDLRDQKIASLGVEYSHLLFFLNY